MASLVYIKETDINDYLSIVHDAIITNYVEKIKRKGSKGHREQMKKNAAFLQEFLIDIKQESKKSLEQMNPLLRPIIEEANLALGHKGGRRLFKDSYNSTLSEDPFEAQLAAIFYATTKNVAIDDSDIKLDSFKVGADAARIDLDQAVLERYKKTLLKNYSEEMTKAINEMPDKYGKIIARQGKVDVQGIEVEIRGNVNARVLRFYKLIKNAKVSAKNYRDQYWKRDEFGQSYSVEGSATLHLGGSNALKAYYGVLTDLGAPKKSAIDSFFHAYYHYKKYGMSDKLPSHIYHIRQIYELIGAGLVSEGVDGITRAQGNVDYLIYNAPDSDMVYVQSTSEIIEELFKYAFETDKNGKSPGDPFVKSVSIVKSLFKALE